VKILLKSFLLLTFLISSAWALDKPTQEETRKVVDYYLQGQKKGPLLAHFQVCSEMGQEGKQDDVLCKDPLKQVSQNEETYVGMMFMVPKGTNEEIILQLEHEGLVRMTREFSVDDAMVYRVFQKVTFNKPGVWTAKILSDRQGQIQNLGESKIQVIK
jgi:hypothetical protein